MDFKSLGLEFFKGIIFVFLICVLVGCIVGGVIGCILGKIL